MGELVEILTDHGPWVAIAVWLAVRVDAKLDKVLRRQHQLTVVIGVLLDLSGIDPAKIKERLTDKNGEG